MKAGDGILSHDPATVEGRLTLAKQDLDTAKQLLGADHYHRMVGAAVHRAIEQSYKALLLFNGQTTEETNDLNQLREASAPYLAFGLYTQNDLLDKLTEFSRNPFPSCGLINFEKEVFAEANCFAHLLFDCVLQLVGLTHRDI